MLRNGLHGPILIQLLVLLFAALDWVRGLLGLNLGAFPMVLKLLYIRVLVYQFGYTYSSEQPTPAMNRAQRRRMYFSVPQKARQAYYGWLMRQPDRCIGADAQGRYVYASGLKLWPVAGGAPTLRASRSGLFWRQTPGGLPVITDQKYFSGNVFFVDSNTAQGGTTAGYGLHPDSAFTDIESCIDSPVYADQGDAIFVLPGHTETVADEITVDVAGISIIGLGEGLARPQLTQNVAGDCIALDADSVVLDNFYFNEATTAPGAGGAAIDINAAHCKVLNCHFDQGANDLEAITITASGDHAEIAHCTHVVTANGPDAAIEIEAIVTDLSVHDCWYQGGDDTNAWDAGAINSGVAHTQCRILDNVFLFGGGVIFSAAATGIIGRNLFGEGTLGSMLDPGSCMCFENYEADAIDQTARLFPTTPAS